MGSALRDVNLDGRPQTRAMNTVETVHMELIVRITAVETVRVIILVTKQLELALNALLDGKINIVTKLVMSDGSVRTVTKHVGIV